jgi:autophagy-related protein 2
VPKRGKAARSTSPPEAAEEQDHLPTAQELAESFLNEEPAVEREELEAAIHKAGLVPNEDSDSASETSDEDNTGTGVGLAVPAFLANFLKGVVDRLRVEITNVKFILGTELAAESDLHAENPPVSAHLVVSSVDIAGFTHAASTDATHSSTTQDLDKRKVCLSNIYGDLVTENALFASLDKVPTAATSRRTDSASPSSPRVSERSAPASAPQLSPVARSSLQRPPSSLSQSAHMTASRMKESTSSSRVLTSLGDRMRGSYHSQDRFADASDDGHSEMSESMHESLHDSMHESHFYPPSSISASQIAPSELEDDPEQEFPFMMDDARSSHGYESQELDPFAALSSSYTTSRTGSSPVRQRYASATAPMTPLRKDDSRQLDRRRPVYSSQPAPRHTLDYMFQSSSTTRGASPPESPSPPKSDSSDSPSEAAEASLAQSMLYSHEEAQSMYMSAIGEAQSEHYDMPGGWAASVMSDGSRSGNTEQAPSKDINKSFKAVDGTGVETPRPRSPSNTSSSPKNKFRKAAGSDDDSPTSVSSARINLVSKRVFSVDEIVLWLPWSTTPEAAAAGDIPPPPPSAQSRQPHGSRGGQHVPGAFSQYQSVFSETFKAGQKSWSNATSEGVDDLAESTTTISADPGTLQRVSDPDIAIDVGNVIFQVDTSATRLLCHLAQQLQAVWASQAPGDHASNPKPSSETAQPTCLLNLQHFTFGFLECLPATASPPQDSISRTTSSLAEPLFEVHAEGLALSNRELDRGLQVQLTLETFRAGYPGDPILSFDRTGKRQSLSRSKVLAKEPNVKLVFKTSQERGSELSLFTLPVSLTLNLQKLDDRLLMFGGVSGILDLSSSVASNSTILGPAQVLKPLPGKVRFGVDEPVVDVPTLSPIKINARFYGASLLLEGRTCAVNLDTGTLSVALRQESARVVIEHIQLRAPFVPNASPSAFSVDVFKTDIRFLVSGVEEDFENLVALIEPSSDRYENDDDVLLDMLRRQRKNGSVLRIEVAKVQTDVRSIENLEPLQQLADELGRLSSGVTKYLPEDDRPGVLILPKIGRLLLQAQVNDKLGFVEIACENIRIAHVGTPLLLGFRIGAVTASREGEVIMDPLLSLDTKTPTPAIMGRFIGNVPESRMKLKFFNVVLEYQVPLILAILGISEAETVEELAMNMAGSVATLRLGSSGSDFTNASPVRNPAPQESKPPLRLDVFVRDCAVGLNPAKSSAKGMFLVSQAQLAVDETEKDGLRLGLDLRRASLLLIDDVELLDPEIAPAPRPYDSDNRSPAIDDLIRQGFQAVASIWSAQTVVSIAKSEHGDTMIDVDVNNKLFTLETCADSQQTLAAVLGGLSPPIPTKKEQMYRTHVVPIENMMASFTGEAFFQSQDEVGAAPIDADLNMEDADQILEDIPSNMDFVGSFYDPDEEASNYNPSVLGSVNRLSSRLLASSKSNKTSFSESIEENFEHGGDNVLIDPSENYVEVFKFKAPARRWNSKAARLDPIYTTDLKTFPLKVTAKFEQITWNLYDGYDWVATRNKIAQAVEKVEARIEERRRARRSSTRDEDDAESEIEDMLFQSIWIAVPPNADERDLRRGINKQIADDYTETGSTRTESVDTRTTGGRPVHRRRKSKALHLERSRKKISFDLQKTVADFFMFPDGSEETQHSLALRVGDFEIYDHVPSSTWKKFLTYLHDAGERQMGKPTIRLDAVTVKPVADLAATEMIIKANLLPIRLHVDQDALDFTTRFFEFKDDRSPPSSGPPGPYIARLEVNTIPVALDYKPKKVDYAGLRSGSTSEFANFIILERAEFSLKRLILYGIQSPDVLQPKLKAIWTADVINNQLPTVLAGLSGVRPFVNVGSGIRDLVVIPMREYRKDGRVMRSIQKGALAFAKTTTSELARLGAKAAIGTQTWLETAEGLLSPASEKRNRSHAGDDWSIDDFSTSPAREEQRAVSNYADQPLNVVTGLRDAWQGLERDLLTAKDAIIAIGADTRDSGSASGAAGVLARHGPTVILRPAIGTFRGIGVTLLGAGNMLDKDSRRKIEDVSYFLNFLF